MDGGQQQGGTGGGFWFWAYRLPYKQLCRVIGLLSWLRFKHLLSPIPSLHGVDQGKRGPKPEGEGEVVHMYCTDYCSNTTCPCTIS